MLNKDHHSKIIQDSILHEVGVERSTRTHDRLGLSEVFMAMVIQSFRPPCVMRMCSAKRVYICREVTHALLLATFCIYSFPGLCTRCISIKPHDRNLRETLSSCPSTASSTSFQVTHRNCNFYSSPKLCIKTGGNIPNIVTITIMF